MKGASTSTSNSRIWLKGRNLRAFFNCFTATDRGPGNILGPKQEWSFLGFFFDVSNEVFPQLGVNWKRERLAGRDDDNCKNIARKRDCLQRLTRFYGCGIGLWNLLGKCSRKWWARCAQCERKVWATCVQVRAIVSAKCPWKVPAKGAQEVAAGSERRGVWGNCPY